MSDANASPSGQLRFHELRSRQLEVWQRGERLLVETLLRDAGGPSLDEESLLELIYGEVVLREQHGERVTVDEYVGRFPQLAERLRKLFEVHRAFPSPASGGRDSGAIVAATHRSPAPVCLKVRCPHCHNPIEVVDDDPSGDVSCPSCGSSFNLAKDVETGRFLDAGRMLGHFQLLDQIGKGAFGEVWKARDTELDRIVALKIPRREHLSEQESEQFLREARAAAQVRHPNIVSVYEIGRERGLIYIASDYIDGASLSEWIEAHPLSVRESVELCATIAEALHHAHDAGIVHRDLKPQNILVALTPTRSASEASASKGSIQARSASEGSSVSITPDPSLARRASVPESQPLTPFITDFGLAKRDAGEITMTVEGAILGTPAYMSPEQARGEAHHADRRSDVYSLGVILFRLLTGELPFRGQRQMLLVQILNEEPPSLRKLDARIPRDVETICLKCLEKDPARRYQSATELSADLRRWLTGHPILARPVSRLERGWRWCRRNPVVASLSAAVVFVLLTGIAVSSFFVIQSKRKAEEVRRHLYAAHMNLAQNAWEANQVGVTLELLERYAPGTLNADLRGFEWHYWNRLCHSYQLELRGHTIAVNFVTFSADGTRVVTAANNRWNHDRPVEVKVWDAMNGKEIVVLNGHTRGIICVAFSPDGKRLMSASADKTVKVWDTTNGQEICTLKWNMDLGSLSCASFSPDAKLLASNGSNGGSVVQVLDISNGQEVLTFKHRSSINCMTFSENGTRLASADNSGMVKLWDVANGTETLTFKLNGDDITVLNVQSLAFSADGKHLKIAFHNQTEQIWDATSGQEIRTFKLNGLPRSPESHLRMTFSPDGNWLASASEDQAAVRVWDATSGEVKLTLKGHTRAVTRVAFSPDGKRLASVSEDQTVVKVWDASSGQETLTLKEDTTLVQSVAFSPNGKLLASASWDSPIRVWNATTGLSALTLQGDTKTASSVAFSPDGRRLASTRYDKVVLWDATSGQKSLTLTGHNGDVWSVQFSPDGIRLASAGNDHTVKVWDVSSGQEMHTLKGHSDSVYSVAFSPDGKRLVSASDTVKVWDALTGRETLTLKGHTGDVRCVSFSPDGKRLASASDDHTVKVWDAFTGRETLTLKGHDSVVGCVVFSADGKRLASASRDRTVKVWDTTSGQETLTLKGNIGGQVSKVAFSPDGLRLASAGGNNYLPGEVKVWDARPWTPELRAEREALSLIRWLQDQSKPKSEWAAAISADQTISEPVRQRALQFAREWK